MAIYWSFPKVNFSDSTWSSHVASLTVHKGKLYVKLSMSLSVNLIADFTIKIAYLVAEQMNHESTPS